MQTLSLKNTLICLILASIIFSLNLLNTASAQPSFLEGTMRVCASYQKQDKSWSPNYPVRVAFIDGDYINKHEALQTNPNTPFLAIVWKRSNKPTYIPLNEEQFNLSKKPALYQDVQGKTWKISRTWQSCANY